MIRPIAPVVLVVEDEPWVLMMAIDIIEEARFEAISARNADEAIAILENRDDIRIIFTDINMPGSMNGLCWLTRCAGDAPDRDNPNVR
jgi:CheY-like chemotaxis protein